MSLEFFVPGVPQTKGSARAFMPKGARHPVVTNDNPKNKGWAKTITLEAQRMARQMGMQPTNGPVMLRLTFYVPRPQRVRESGTPSTTRPDLDKMERSVLDALEGVFYLNDAQVCVLHSSKVYGEPVGVHVNFSWAGKGVMGMATTKKKAVKPKAKAKKKPVRRTPPTIGTAEPVSS